jgi:hypothetical protein
MQVNQCANTAISIAVTKLAIPSVSYSIKKSNRLHSKRNTLTAICERTKCNYVIIAVKMVCTHENHAESQ